MGKDFYSLLCKSKCTTLSFSFVRALLYAQTSLSGDDDDTVRACAFCVLYISSVSSSLQTYYYYSEEEDDDEEEEEPKEQTAFFNNKVLLPFFSLGMSLLSSRNGCEFAVQI